MEQKNISHFWQTLEFAYAAAKFEQLPLPSTPEVAFWGRSNVGKSSLINALTGRKSLARTSKAPGCTKTINFYTPPEQQFFLVDLPGYSYAGVSKKTRLEWNKLTDCYLKGRATLLRVMLLIDSRRKLMEADLRVMKVCDQVGMSYQIILTKIDELTTVQIKEVQQELEQIALKHPALHPIFLLTSSRKKCGLDELRDEIATVVSQARQTDL